jgi:hypothetical protein
MVQQQLLGGDLEDWKYVACLDKRVMLRKVEVREGGGDV